MSGTTARWAGANNLRRIGQIRAAVGKSLYVVETEDCSNADRYSLDDCAWTAAIWFLRTS